MTQRTVRINGWQWFLIIPLLFVFTVPLRAAVPDNIDYQGYLTDDLGSPVNGNVFITFSLYNVDTGGIALWSDIQSVDVTNGLFMIKLGGSGAPFPPGLFDDPLWLSINVAGDGEMTPRIEMSSAGFAHKADDALTLEGQTAASLDQSAHVSDTGNPHSVTAAQTGAVSSANFALHTGDPAAHHSKTTSFTELVDQASEAQLPAGITRDSELASEIATHAGDASAHHSKTTTFPELTGQIVDAQIPALIARDVEVMPIVLANDGPGSTLNADTLDGLDSTAFMSSATDNWVNVTGDTMSGNLNVIARIGIGTTFPSRELDVRGGRNGSLAYFLNYNTTPGGNTYGLDIEASAYPTGTGEGIGATFYAAGGSSSGAAYGSMHTARANGTSVAYGVYSNATPGSTTGREYAFYGLGDSYFSGNVGIGTTAPGSKLTVAGGATVGSTYAGDFTSDGNLAVANRLGIGTTNPVYALHVEDGINSYLGFFNNNNIGTGNTGGIQARADALDTSTGEARAGYFWARGGSTSGTTYGTQIYTYASGASTSYGVFSDADGGSTTGREWAFYGLGDTYVSGDVGIGTTAPSAKLQVIGSTVLGGGSSSATGTVAIALGANADATNNYAIATGTGTIASGLYSTAMGVDIEVSGNRSFGIGLSGPAANVSADNVMSIMGGNVGINTTAPTYRLHVIGNAAGTSWTNLSSRDYKENIQKVDDSMHHLMLAKLMSLDINTYKYKKEYGGDDTTKLGFIAEEMPKEVLSKDGKGVDVYELLTYTIAAMKAQQSTIEAQRAKNRILEERLTVLEAQLNK